MLVGSIARYAAVALAVWALSTGPISAASYSEARDSFDSTLTFEQRITTQVLLNAAGYAPVVPMEHLSPQGYEAIMAFEDGNGFAVSGIVTASKMRRLAYESAAYLKYVGFREVPYPGRALSIWVPLGLGLEAKQDGSGLHFRDRKGRLALDLVSVDGESIQVAHDRRIAEEKARAATVRDDNFSVGDKWFAITSTWPDGSDHYYRLYQDGSRATGFALAWRKSIENINAEGIAAIMSGSLRSAVLDEPFVDPPKIVTTQVSPSPAP